MKTRIKPLFFVTIALSAITTPIQAGILYWDGNSTTANADGGNGTWNASLTNWDSLATAGADTAWPSTGTDNDAVFGGTAGTVTVDAAGVTANDLTFNTANYIIQGGAITLNGTTPTISNAVTATINSVIAGTVGLNKTGTGTLILGGTNNYTGATIVNAGTVQFSKTAALYGGNSSNWTAANINVKSTGTLALNVGGTNEFTTGDVTTLLTNLGGANGTSTTGLSAGSTLGFDTTNASGGTFTVSNLIADSTGAGGGSVGLTKLGTNSLVLTNATNTYTGVTTFSGGTVNVANLTNYGVAGSLGLRSQATDLLGGNNIGLLFLGGTLQYTGSTAQSTNRQIRVGTAGAVIDASGTGTGTLNFTHSGANANLFNTSGHRTITLTGSNTGDNTFAIKLENQNATTGLTSLVKSGAGKWILTNANTYTGNTTLSGGTLHLSGGNNRLATTGAVVFGGSSTLNLGGNSQTLANLSVTTGGTVNNIITNGSLTLSGASDLVLTTPSSPTTAGAYSLDASGLSSLTISKSANSLTVGGNLAATFSQTGTLTLSSTSNTITVANLNVGTISGVVNTAALNSGTLLLGTANVINATNVTIGGTRSDANMSFLTGLTSPTLTFRGVTGGTTRVTKFVVGYNSAGSSLGNTQVADFSLGSIDARITDLFISQGGSGLNNTPTVNGTFTMGIGTLDATRIAISDNTNEGGNSANTGTFNQNAGTVTVGTLTLGRRIGATTAPTLLPTYNLGTSTTTGILKAATILAGGGAVNGNTRRKINFNNGTIQNLAGGDLIINGSATLEENRINVVLASSGTHTFHADASQTITLGTFTNVSGAGGTLTKTGEGTLILAGTNSYTGATDVQNGTLAVNGNSLSDTNKLTINGVAKVDLTGTEIVDSLFFDATQQPSGTYSASSVPAGATITTASFAGTGTLFVSPGPGYSAWQSANSTSQTADLDHDNDGVSNGVEHFLGGIANTTGNSNPLPGVINDAGALSVTWVRHPDFPDFPGNYGTGFVVETSTTLANSWTPAVVGVGAGFVEITDNNVKYNFPAGTKNFARLKVITP